MIIFIRAEKEEMLVEDMYIKDDSIGLENIKRLKDVSIAATTRTQLLYSLIIGTGDQSTRMYQT
jgi:hypothetical protein